MADPRTTQIAADPTHAHPAWRPRVVEDDWAPGLSVWPVAQRSPAAQRRGRYVAGSAAHPARMLPDLAAHAIRTYTRPGELVADPLAGTAPPWSKLSTPAGTRSASSPNPAGPPSPRPTSPRGPPTRTPPRIRIR